MKVARYLLIGALLPGLLTPSMAQNDVAIKQTTQIIKSTSPQIVERALKDIAKANKKNSAALTGIGHVFSDQKNTELTMKYTELAMIRDKRYAPAYISAGDVEAAKDDGNVVIGRHQQMEYLDPKNPGTYFKYASTLRGRSPEEAAANLNELRAQCPDIAVDTLTGRTYHNPSMLDKSIQTYEKVDKNKFEDVDITNYVMAGYLPQKCQKSLDMAPYGFNKNPHDAAWNRLTFCNYTDKDRTEGALEYADRLFNASSSAKISGYDYTYYGQAYLANKRNDNAIDMFKKATSANADSKDLANSNRKSLSGAYLVKGGYANATTYCEECLINVKGPAAADSAGLGSIYMTMTTNQTGEEQKAIYSKANEIYKQLDEKFPTNIDFASSLRARANSNLDPETKEGLAKPFYEALTNSLNQGTDYDSVDNTRLIEVYRYLSYYCLLKEGKLTTSDYQEKILGLDPENEVAK